MPTNVIMPALEMAQETGKVVSWLKKEGDRVTKGEPLLEIETDKAVMEIEATGDGILAGVKAKEGDAVPVGQTIAWLIQPGEALPEEQQISQSGRRTDSAPAHSPVDGPAVHAPAASQQEPRISPKARRLARELGVDLKHVRPSGAGGEILTADIEAAAKGTTSTAGSATPHVETPSSIGRLMAERTAQSWTTVPHFFVTREVDASGLVEMRGKMIPRIEQAHHVKLTHTDLLVGLVARVLKKHPLMNGSWNGTGITLNPEINLGIAMAVQDGVVAAVIPHADSTELGEIAVRRRDLTEKARANALRPADITGATFTISNLGMYHVDSFTAIVVPNQAGILAVGAIKDRVVPVDGQVCIRPIVSITLSCDHRVVDGARGAAFLDEVAGAMRHPAEWLS